MCMSSIQWRVLNSIVVETCFSTQGKNPSYLQAYELSTGFVTRITTWIGSSAGCLIRVGRTRHVSDKTYYRMFSFLYVHTKSRLRNKNQLNKRFRTTEARLTRIKNNQDTPTKAHLAISKLAEKQKRADNKELIGEARLTKQKINYPHPVLQNHMWNAVKVRKVLIVEMKFESLGFPRC